MSHELNLNFLIVQLCRRPIGSLCTLTTLNWTHFYLCLTVHMENVAESGLKGISRVLNRQYMDWYRAWKRGYCGTIRGYFFLDKVLTYIHAIFSSTTVKFRKKGDWSRKATETFLFLLWHCTTKVDCTRRPLDLICSTIIDFQHLDHLRNVLSTTK